MSIQCTYIFCVDKEVAFRKLFNYSQNAQVRHEKYSHLKLIQIRTAHTYIKLLSENGTYIVLFLFYTALKILHTCMC